MATRYGIRVGETYNRLSYLKDVEPCIRSSGVKLRKCLWLCSCGRKTSALLVNVMHSRTKSCGCLTAEGSHTSHGLSKSLIYDVWTAMKQRCSNPNSASYKHYGGRGIDVCERWHDFRNFYRDVGAKPSPGHELDRKNNNKGYYKENCHWVLHRSNCQNTRASKRWHVSGVTYISSVEAARILGVCAPTVANWCEGFTRRGKYYPSKPGCYSYYAYPNSKGETL